MTKPFTIIIASGFICAAQAFAHRPYEHVASSFTRGDGVTVSAVEHYVDGLFGADPVSVQFRLSDGTVLAQTDRTRDGVVVRSTPVGIEVYRFQTDWIPIASSVQQFDGYSLTDVTTSRKRFFSSLVHTHAHWRAYAIALGFAGLFVAGWLTARAIPKRGWLAALRVFAFVSITLSAGLYALLVLWAAPVSPFILCILVAICFALCLPMRRFIRHARAA